jgi:hypothetical protein
MRTLVPMAITISARAMMILSIMRHLLCYRIWPNLLRTSEQQGKTARQADQRNQLRSRSPRRKTYYITL